MRHQLLSTHHYVNRQVNFGFFSAMLEKLGIRSYPWKSYYDNTYQSMYLTFGHKVIYLDIESPDWTKLISGELKEIPVTLLMSSGDTQGQSYFFNSEEFLLQCMRNQQGPVRYPFTRTSIIYQYEIQLGELPEAKPIRTRSIVIEVVRNGKLIPTYTVLQDGSPALKFEGRLVREYDWKFIFTI